MTKIVASRPSHLEKAEEEKAEVPEARLIYTAQRGFHFSVPAHDTLITMKLPPRFIEVVRNRASISCTTRALIRYNGIQLFDVF